MGYQFNPITGNLDLVGSGGGNPFDQNLNTTDGPTFASLTVNGAFIIDGIDFYPLDFDPVGSADNAQAYAIQRANHTGTQPASTITGLATVATSGSAADLTGTLDDARLSSSVALLTATQTFTNKTLTAPVISNGTTSTNLTADASNILSVANSTSASGLRVFNTRTDSSNYERAILDWTTTANNFTIGTQNAGTGTARRLRLQSAESVDIFCGNTTRVMNLTTSAASLFYPTNFQFYSGAGDPTTSTTPFQGSGTCAVYKNTTTGVVSLWVRDGTTMKKIALA